MNKPNHIGLNYCPSCGCNIGVISRALELTMPQIPARPERPEREREPEKAKPALSSAEIVRLTEEGRANGRKVKDVMLELGLPPDSIYNHRYKVEREQAKALLAKAKTHLPRSAPALVEPKSKRVREGALRAGSITQQQKDEMKKRKAAGESIASIAESMGFKIGTVGPIIYAKKKSDKTEVAA